MTLPSLANLTQLDDRLPGGLTPADLPRAQGVLDDASALIRAEAGKTWTTDGLLDAVPDIVVTVCIAAARRAFINPEGITREALDGAEVDYATSAGDVYLKANEKALVRRAAGKTGVWVMNTTRGDDLETVRGFEDRCEDLTDPVDRLAGAQANMIRPRVR